MTRKANEPVKLFCSYSHRDERYLTKLKTSLAGLRREGLINEWHDRKIRPGQEWEEVIDENLKTSEIILLLITPDFMQSDYSFEKEMSQALKRHDRGEARVIPIIVRPTDWEGAPFGKLQALPRNAKPITEWSNRDRAWLDVVRGIREALKELTDEPAERKQKAPPTGTVTFLFTDIEGSATLWESYPTRMRTALTHRDDILRAAVEAKEGYVFKTIGDAYCAAFTHPEEALGAALSAQRAFFGEEWDEAIGLRVRMALHTGAAEERDGDYFGPTLNRVAYLLGAGHGGQILLSGATYDLVRDHLESADPEAQLLDLGEYHLKDLAHPEHIFQLAVPDLPDRFPPLRTRESPDDLDGNRYRLKDFLGSGGMAKVYLAHDESLDRDVAIKVLHPRYVNDEEFVERFKREARSAAKLSHPNIVPVYDRGEKKDGTYYIVMEYLPGGTLKERIVSEGPLPPHTAVAVTLQIAQALSEAHEKGVIHRDIKPQNVLLTRTGEVKVTDFGLARAATLSTLTHSGVALGTPHYISPEQAEGESATFKSDFYSLGVVLYEMLIGELPYNAETPMGIAMKKLRGQLRSPREINPDIPEQVEAVTLRLLATDPKDRYGEAAELIDDLERVLRSLEDGEGGIAEQPTPSDSGADKDSVVNITRSSTVEVPDLAGQNALQASSTLADVGLTLGNQNEVPSDTIPKGEVIKQSPEAGTEVQTDSLVNVTLSSGPETIEVPNLAGLNHSEASNTLAAAGLKLGSQDEAPNDTVPKGRTVKQHPSMGTKVKRGSLVSVTVSSGREQASTAKRTDHSTDKDRPEQLRQQQLHDQQLRGSHRKQTEPQRRQRAEQPRVRGDEPVEQTRHRQQAEKASTAVPDVSRRNLADAAKILRSKGLVLGNSRVQKSTEFKGIVISTDPAAGSEVEVGNSITPIVSDGSESLLAAKIQSFFGGQSEQPTPSRALSPSGPPTQEQQRQKDFPMAIIITGILVLMVILAAIVETSTSHSSSPSPSPSSKISQSTTPSSGSKPVLEETMILAPSKSSP